jgi:hypothetical protein
VRRTIAHAYDEDLPGDGAVRCYRRADLRDDRELVVVVLAHKCAYKSVPIPTLETITAGEKITELKADWQAMLAHQLPVLPPIDEFIETLGGVFAWLGGAEPVHLEPVPALRERLELDWVAPPTIARWPGGAPLEQIRFASANHLLVELGYQGTTRLIEPYAFAPLPGRQPAGLRDQGRHRQGPFVPR